MIIRATKTLLLKVGRRPLILRRRRAHGLCLYTCGGGGGSVSTECLGAGGTGQSAHACIIGTPTVLANNKSDKYHGPYHSRF